MSAVWKTVSPSAAEQIGGFKPFADLPGNDSAALPSLVDQVEIEPLFAKRWRVSGSWTLPPRVLLVDWMMWIERGEISLKIDGISGPLTCRSGTLIVIPAGVNHSASCMHSRSARLITAHFKAQLFGHIGCLSLLGLTGTYRCFRDAPVGDAMLQLCRETIVKGVLRQRSMRSQVERILLYVLRNHGSSLRPDRAVGRQQNLARLQPVLRLIDESMEKSNLSVPELAAAAAVSEVYLRRMFRLTLGIGPAAYMQRRRVQHAGQLLRTTQLNVKEISKRSGFSDPHFMMRIFRKWMHQTPTEFREAREL